MNSFEKEFHSFPSFSSEKPGGALGVEARKAATQRMDKSSSLVIDPPDGGCRVSFFSK